MAILFTIEQFHGVFRDYNTAVWPAQWFFLAMALVAIAAALMVGPGLLATAHQPQQTQKS